MGTVLYEAGYDLCFEELNVSKPEEIYTIHQAYIEAGATIIQTNSYAANVQKLKRYGLQESVGVINQASVRLARKAVQNSGKKHVFVVGTVGGIQGFQSEQLDHKESMQALVEQVDLLVQEGVDGLLFETFYDFMEIKQLVIEARKRTNLLSLQTYPLVILVS